MDFKYPFCLILLLCRFSLKSTDLDTSMIVALFADYFQNFDSWLMLVTDVSKTGAITSIAGCSSSKLFGYSVKKANSIFTVKSLSIGMALDELVPLDLPVIILTDSLSVLLALQSIILNSSRVILWLNKISRLRKFFRHFTFLLSPGTPGYPSKRKG